MLRRDDPPTYLIVLVEAVVGHDESPQPRHVGVGALPRDEKVVGVPAREGEATDGRQRAQLGILEKEKALLNRKRIAGFTQPILAIYIRATHLDGQQVSALERARLGALRPHLGPAPLRVEPFAALSHPDLLRVRTARAHQRVL